MALASERTKYKTRLKATTRAGRGDGAHRMNSGCGLSYLFPFPFLPGMAATFADYLGMAMLTPALPYWCAEAGMSKREVVRERRGHPGEEREREEVR